MTNLPDKNTVLDQTITTENWKTGYGQIIDFIPQILGAAPAATLVVDQQTKTVQATTALNILDLPEGINQGSIEKVNMTSLPDGVMLYFTPARNKMITFVDSAAAGGFTLKDNKNITLKHGEVLSFYRDGEYLRLFQTSTDILPEVSASAAGKFLTVNTDGVTLEWKEIPGRYIFEIFFSTANDVNLYPGAYKLDGTVITNCDTLYPEFWTKILTERDLYTSTQTTGIRAVDESTWQSEVSTNGQTGAFVIDETAKSVRLPKITKWVKGLADLAQIGQVSNDPAGTGAGNSVQLQAFMQVANNIAEIATLNIQAIEQSFTEAVNGIIAQGNSEVARVNAAGQTIVNTAQTAKDWATKMDGLVNNEDYSSKFYATRAQTWAEGDDSSVISIGGEKSAKGWANNAKSLTDGALNGTNITNCLVEVTQNVKVILQQNELKIQTGSVIYYPNGLSGTNIVWGQYTLPNDIVITRTSDENEYFVVINVTNGTASCVSSVSLRAGAAASQPTDGTIYYQTDTGYIKSYVTGDNLYSAVVLKYSYISGWYSLHNVYNGVSFCGNALFQYPTMKILCPNGRNPDGTLNNTERDLTSTVTPAYISAAARDDADNILTVSSDSVGIVVGRFTIATENERYGHTYNPILNYIFVWYNSTYSIDGYRVKAGRIIQPSAEEITDVILDEAVTVVTNTDFSRKFCIVDELPANPSPDVFYFIPEN